MTSEHVTVVSLAGEIDIRTASDAQAKVTRALTEEDPRILVLDLEQVSFLDSVGIGFLVALNQQAQTGGVSLRLRNLQHQVQRALATTGLVSVLHIESP